MAEPVTDKLLIGWREWVALPELSIPHIKAKIDTGARTSALHAFELHEFQRDGQDWVRFRVHPLQRTSEPEIECEVPIIDRRTVTDSGGHQEVRIVIETPVRMGGTQWPIEMTLTARDDMKFRMLLGRTAMRGRLVVDPETSFLTGRPKRKKSKQ